MTTHGHDAAHPGEPGGIERDSGVRALRALAASDALAAFEAALDRLAGSVGEAAARAARGEEAGATPARTARDLLRFCGRLLRQDARRRTHEIDRESGWIRLFAMWVDDDAGLFDDFDGFLGEAATLPADRRLLVRLAADELSDLAIVFPPVGDIDVRRAVLRASRARLEAVIRTLSLVEGRWTPETTGESADGQSGGRARRVRLETEFLESPTAEGFRAIKEIVPPDQWAAARARLLGHLQKHQREATLVFRLYYDEGLVLDADGMVVTQPIDPDVLAAAAADLEVRDPAVAAGWLLVAAHRLADSDPRARSSDVARHLVRVRDLVGPVSRETEFQRVLRSFRFRHAHVPDLLSRLSEAGL